MVNLSTREAYIELSYYTLAHPDPAFIHQHIVDAYAAQNADKDTKPINITFALVGLYLAIEKGFSGKQVQQAHMKLAKHRRQWFRFKLPENRGDTTVFDVLAASPGKQRDEMIRQWCVSVWNAYEGSQQQVRDIIQKELGV
jgi:hypothetical protein